VVIEVFWLLAMMVAQVLVLLVLPHSWAPAAAILPALVVRFLCGGWRRTGRIVLGLSLIALPVVVARLVSTPPLALGGLARVTWILDYPGRLIAAGLIAEAFLVTRGTLGLYRGLRGLLRPFPAGMAAVVGDIALAALYLIPTITRRFQESHRIARLRFAGTRRRWGARRAATLRAALVSSSSVPRRRAEAMVVRGMVNDE
jgi:hypothetical protein